MSKQPRLFPIGDPELFPYNTKGHFDVPQKRDKRWVEDVYMKGSSVLDEGHEYIGTSLTKPMYAFAVACVMIVFLLLYGRVMFLQVMAGTAYAQQAESNRTRHIAVAAERGDIFDRHGVPLTRNIPKFSLHISPLDIPGDDDSQEAISNALASILHRPYDEVLQDIQHAASLSDRELLLYEDVTQHEAIALSVISSDVPSLRVGSGISRSYDVFEDPIESLSHIVGYEGKISESEYESHAGEGYAPTDYIGKQGIEVQYENVLRGTKGDRVLEVNSRGIALNVLSEEVSSQGQSVVLTVDSDMQRAAEQALTRGLEFNGKHQGVVVVQAVNSGEILAMVSLPGFSNESFARGLSYEAYEEILEDPHHPLINRSVAGLYPSGSIIKPIMALAALTEDVITPHTTIVSSGGVGVGPWFFPDWKAGGHGRVNVKEAIADSVNTFFYVIGGGFEERDGLGVERIKVWLDRFGFGRPTGVDILHEKIGLIPDPTWKQQAKNEQWYIGDTYNLSIGQGDLLITPLQITNAIAAIANGGRLYKPRLISSIGEKGFVSSYETIGASPEDFEVIQDGMRDTVIYGSAKSMATLPIMVAGKTGTAQWSNIHDPHAWFVGFAPYRNPQIAITVLVEEGEEGSRVAVPIAREIFEWWAKHGFQIET